MAITHGFVQAVGIGRHAVFQIEQAVGVAVYLILGRRREPNQQGIEILEDGAVLLETERCASSMMTRSKWPDPETPLTVGHVVDQAHHRRIGRDVDPSLRMSFSVTRFTGAASGR